MSGEARRAASAPSNSRSTAGRRGSRSVRRPCPVLDGAQIRSRNGGAILDFADGSRLNVLPFQLGPVPGDGQAAEVSLVYGRVTFQLPAQTRLEAAHSDRAAPSPSADQVMGGELFAGGDGDDGRTDELRRAPDRGARRNQAHDDGEPRARVPAEASGDPGPLFSAEAPSEEPGRGARGRLQPEGRELRLPAADQAARGAARLQRRPHPALPAPDESSSRWRRCRTRTVRKRHPCST